MERHGGAWLTVRRRGNRKEKNQATETTFFVSNLPNVINNNMLGEAFQEFGGISDTYVARKKDARANFFGFVRLLNVTNPEELLGGMNNVNIQQARVAVSVAKYDRKQSRVEPPAGRGIPKIWVPRQPAAGLNGGRVSGGVVSDGRSYRDALNNTKQETKSIIFEGEGHLYPRNCIGKYVIGDAKNSQTFAKLEKAILGWGFPESSLFYVGGMKCMITFRSNEIATDFVNGEGWKEHFDSMKVWNGEYLETARIAKLRMVGVPLVLRDDENFRMIGELFGKIVGNGEFDWGNIDISAGYCLFLTEMGSRIDEVINLAWKNRMYSVWVSELGDPWVPEFGVYQSVMETDGLEDELEDGEFRLPSLLPAGAGDPSREEETNRRMCMGRIFQDLSSPNKAAHVDESMHVEAEAFNSKKRPRRFRSPDDVDFDLGPLHPGLMDEDNSPLPFPDLNSVIPDTCPSAAALSSEFNNGETGINSWASDLNFRGFGGGVDQITQEVGDTVRVGAGIGIQLHDFEKQVRKLVECEGVQNVPQ
ncbi:hypothetical protein L1987_17849 [Smallanthus sonchifolius]|uniref:Uncharacterized protein n=1 Tax=Smallanthus sonchifolius TaxID=185202 RepID=A0ACB9IZM1_9ASTR|nr:hypothetical protein L1987_17849 [Smallanthus sonchifolius]